MKTKGTWVMMILFFISCIIFIAVGLGIIYGGLLINKGDWQDGWPLIFLGAPRWLLSLSDQIDWTFWHMVKFDFACFIISLGTAITLGTIIMIPFSLYSIYEIGN